MPLDLRLDPADALGLRFARSPVWETLHALRTAREPRRQGHHLSWLRSVDVEAVRGAAGVLAPVVPAVGWQPDFLSPIPAGDGAAVRTRGPAPAYGAGVGAAGPGGLTRVPNARPGSGHDH